MRQNNEWFSDFAEAVNAEARTNHTPEQLEQIKRYYDNYRKSNPHASKRNAKRATIRKFNINIKK